jgi:hypothetical protein
MNPLIAAVTADRELGRLLAKCLRMLSSPNDGDLVAAGHGIVKTLANAGCDIHDLAAAIEEPNSGFDEAEAKKIYDAGFADGAQQTKTAVTVANGASYHDMALYCQQHSSSLRSNEREFINDMAAKTVWREPTEKQGAWLKSIYYKLGGRA